MNTSSSKTPTQAAIRDDSAILHALDEFATDRAVPGIAVKLKVTLDQICKQILTDVDQLTDLTPICSVAQTCSQRPIVSSLSAAAGETLRCAGPTPRAMAAVIEIVHFATLCHDDVIDDAATRRGLPSWDFRFGNNDSDLAGDLLNTGPSRWPTQSDSTAAASGRSIGLAMQNVEDIHELSTEPRPKSERDNESSQRGIYTLPVVNAAPHHPELNPPSTGVRGRYSGRPRRSNRSKSRLLPPVPSHTPNTLQKALSPTV